MKIVKANAQIIKQHNEPNDLYKQVEKVGRICYKSEANITDDSAVKFVTRLKNNGHMAMLEHATVYFNLLDTNIQLLYKHIPIEKLKYITITKHYISGSFRALYELLEFYVKHVDSANIILDQMIVILNETFPEIFSTLTHDLRTDVSRFIENTKTQYTAIIKMCTREEFIKHAVSNKFNFELSKHLTHSILFICDRGVSHEFVRHRPASFAQESTRYCCYANDKFGREITIIQPCFWNKNDTPIRQAVWEEAMKQAETNYFKLIDNGAVAQEARDVLPNSLKTELVVTATEEEWQHIINLRYIGITGKPHPQMVEVMEIARPLLEKSSDYRLKFT